nr:hypothetical protein [Tanacetum cinerariifolium]
MILEFVENGTLIWPMIEENDGTRPRKYSELTHAKAIQADCDVKITNIILQDTVKTHKVNHIIETDIVKLMVETESFGMISDDFDKEIGSSDGLQPKQADLSCVHALIELDLHEICVVPSMHEANQYWLCAIPEPV